MPLNAGPPAAASDRSNGGPRRIVVIQDSLDFGGHEIAFLKWLPALIESPSVQAIDFLIPAGNSKFAEALQPYASSKLNVTTMPYSRGRAENLLAPLRMRYGRAAAKFIASKRADIVLLLQGGIENCATPLRWMPAGVDVVSYIPMAHSSGELGYSRFKAVCLDRFKRPYFQKPKRTIVVSRAVADQLVRAGRRGSTYVVENVPPEPDPEPKGKDEARRALGLPPSGRIALYIGRFDAHQKGLDRLVRDMRADASKLADWHFVFVGHGAAENEIRGALSTGAIRGEIRGWTSEPRSYLAAADVLLLPSRFEGVPLIMLEAFQVELPMLASNIDVFREYMPADFIRDFEAPVALAAALDRMTQPAVFQAYRAHAATVLQRLDLGASRRAFVSAVLGEP